MFKRTVRPWGVGLIGIMMLTIGSFAYSAYTPQYGEIQRTQDPDPSPDYDASKAYNCNAHITANNGSLTVEVGAEVWNPAARPQYGFPWTASSSAVASANASQTITLVWSEELGQEDEPPSASVTRSVGGTCDTVADADAGTDYGCKAFARSRGFAQVSPQIVGANNNPMVSSCFAQSIAEADWEHHPPGFTHDEEFHAAETRIETTGSLQITGAVTASANVTRYSPSQSNIIENALAQANASVQFSISASRML